MSNRGCNLQTSTSPLTRVHRLHRQYTHTPNNWISTSMPQDKFQGQRRLQRPLQRQETQPQGQHGRCLPLEKLQSTVLRLHAGTTAHGPTDQERNAELWARSATTVADSDIFQQYAGKGQTIKIMKRLQSEHMDMEEQPPDYFQSEYTTPYFITNEQAKAPIKCLKTTARVHHIQDRDTKHIRPL